MHADLESKRAQVLGNIFSIASKISESSVIEFDDDGIAFRLVSPTVSLKMEMKVDSSFFDSYIVFGNKVTCQINNKPLAFVLKKKWTTVAIEIDNEEEIKIKTQSETNIDHTFNIFLESAVDIDTTMPSSNGTRVICRSDTFDEVMGKFGANDFAVIRASHDRFSLASQDMATVLNEKSSGDTQIHGREAKCRFIFRDFAKILKIANLLSSTTVITIREREPLSVTASMGHRMASINAAISSESSCPKQVADYDDDEDVAVISRPGISRVTATVRKPQFLSDSD